MDQKDFFFLLFSIVRCHTSMLIMKRMVEMKASL
jgi:hypothetical protein